MAPAMVELRPSLHEQYADLEREYEARDHVTEIPAFVTNLNRKGATVTSPTTQQGHEPVDIDWVPSFSKYQARVQQRLKHEQLSTELPDGFPSSVTYEACWTGDDFKGARKDDFIHDMTEEQIAEIEAALSYFKGLSLPMDSISPTTFPLPALSKILAQIASDVMEGRGFAILRGLNPTKYSTPDNIMLYAGISSYIGRPGAQDSSGNVLVHIKDVGAAVAPNDKRQSPYANNAQPFHNDLGDIIAMYVVDRAESGGRSNIASTAHVYNAIAANRPDLVDILAKDDWAFDKHTEEPSTYYTRPVLFHSKLHSNGKNNDNDRVFFCFSRRQLTGSTVSPRPASLPALTEAQAEALDAVHFTAAASALSIQLSPGDVQFVNNLAVFHSREAFTDSPDNHKRHIIRMWLRNDELAWPTPPGLQEVWDEIYGSERDRVWYMNPVHSAAHVISRTKSCHG